jgi:hypothetical protein
LDIFLGFETTGGMKVLAVKGIEKLGNLWAVRYSRHHGRNVQDAMFFCDTPDAAKAKYRELLDVLLKQNGVYVGSKEKRKSGRSRRAGGLTVVSSPKGCQVNVRNDS